MIKGTGIRSRAVLCGYYGVDDFGRLLNSHESRDTISPPEKEMMATMTSMER